jgi:hypothetical protein
MCVIIGLPKGLMLDYSALKNSALNNPDGFGIIVTNENRMEVTKKVNPKGNDPEEIQKILEQFKEHDRYLHLRYNTVGKTSFENAHPFTVYNSGDHRIEFMHNGTISEFRPPTGSDQSDTAKFAGDFIAPLLERLKEIDPNDPFLTSLIENRMGAMSRGLLISTLHGPTFLGKWKSIKADDGETLLAVSNDDYFDREQSHRRNKYDPPKSYHNNYGHGHGGGQSVIPFPENKAPANTGGGDKSTSSSASTKTSAENIVDIATINANLPRGREIDPKEFVDYIDTGEATLTDESITYFQYLSTFETTRFASNNPETFAILFENVVARYCDIFADKEDLEEKLEQGRDKHKKASKMIEAQKDEIERLKALLDEKGVKVA